MVKAIKLISVKDIYELNNIATRYSFDIWGATNDGTMVDLKSLLGLYLLLANEKINVVVEDNINADALWTDLEKYLI